MLDALSRSLPVASMVAGLLLSSSAATAGEPTRPGPQPRERGEPLLEVDAPSAVQLAQDFGEDGEDAAAVEPAPPTDDGALPAPTAPAPVAEEPAPIARTESVKRAPPPRVVEAVGLDARVRRLSDSVALAIKRLPGDHRVETFSVMPFASVGAETESRQLGVVVSDLVLTNLARDHRLVLTERAQLNQILDEQALGQLGVTDPARAATVGQIAGARAIVLGEVSDVGDSFKVTARVVDTESGAVLAADEASLPKEELIAFSADAVVLKSRMGATFRSAVAPGWGQAYNGQSVKAALVGGSVGALVGMTAIAALTSTGIYLLYLTWRPDSAAHQALFFNFAGDKATAEQQIAQLRLLNTAFIAGYWITALVGVAAAGAWGLGVVDAYLSGTDVESLDSALLRE